MTLEYFLIFCVLVEALLRFLPSVTDTFLEYRTKNLMIERNKQRLIPFVGLIKTYHFFFDDVNKATYPYNPPSYSIVWHVFLSGDLSVLSGGTVILLTLVTTNTISRC